MEFIGGFIGIFLALGLLLLIVFFRVFLALQDWMVLELKRRRKKDVTLTLFHAGQVYYVKHSTIRDAARAALKSDKTPHRIQANREIVWQSTGDNPRRALERLAK